MNSATIKLVVELELWSRPHRAAFDAGGKAIAKQCTEELNLNQTVVSGVSFLSDPIDVQNLRQAIADGELARHDFSQFCRSRGLHDSIDDEWSAACFLAHEYGQPLAWLHIPYDDAGRSIYIAIADWARRHQLVVVEPCEMNCLYGEETASYHWHADRWLEADQRKGK